jgi:steroid delta-isomerase-like uncharacterized protein
MSIDTQELAREHSRAWADHNADAIVGWYTDDCVFHMHGIADALHGRAAVRDAIAGMFQQSPDLRFELARMLFGTDHYVSEYTVKGTIGGRSFACAGVDVFTLQGGRISRKDSYIDGLAYARQVGLEPAAAG